MFERGGPEEALVMAALAWHVADGQADWLMSYRAGSTYNDLLAALQARDAAAARLHQAAREYVCCYGMPDTVELSVSCDRDTWIGYLNTDARYAPGRRPADAGGAGRG